MFSKIPSIFIVFVFSSSAMAVMPFTISGSAIKTVFDSEMVWRKLGGPVQEIQFRGHKNNKSTYWIMTIEKGPCLTAVEVTNTTPEELSPLWKVTNVDVTACPGALP